MVEDELRTFPATEVLYVGARDESGPARALDERLLVPFRFFAAPAASEVIAPGSLRGASGAASGR